MVATMIAMGLAASAAGPATVRVDDIDFKPHRLRVEAGTRVTWRFREPYTPHNVHSKGRKRFKSSPDEMNGDNYSVTFRKPGTYRYVCTIHFNMKARVVVS